uniref:Uncharacterized protein n=1 Tax=Glycine max TaxID=3847 RepID=A0A0R0EL44_SOYBN
MATNTTTASSSVVFSPEKLNFWLDNPSPISLTWDQVKHCREALTSLKDKFDHTPESITHEFKLLEANRAVTESETDKICAVALDRDNFSKNRHDVYPLDKNRIILKSTHGPLEESYGGEMVVHSITVY